MATQVSLNSGAVASAGTLALQTNGTTEAVSISTGQVATLAQNPILTSGTANGVAYLNGSKAVTSGSALTFDGTNFATTGTASATKMIPTGGSATGNGMYLPASNTLAWSNNGSETMRLDSAGNLGLGVTPSAWTAGRTALQIYGSSTAVYFAGATTNTVFANNYYYNAGDKFVSASGYAQNYQQQSGGSHVWLTSSATSGGAGATATMNTLMTLDASGNLGVGVTSMNASLHVQGAATTDGAISFNQQLASTTAYNSSPLSGTMVALKYTSGGSLAGMGGWAIGKENATDGNFASYFAMYTRPNGGANTERARIDSSGNLLVGTTSATFSGATRQFVVNNSGGYAAGFGNTSAGAETVVIQNADTTGTRRFVVFKAGTSGVGEITSNGSTTTYGTTSDYRLKENVAPMIGALAKVAALKPCTYTWKATGEAGEGFIAHELAEIAPDAVTGEKDGTRIEQYEINPAVPATFDGEGNELTPAVEAVMGEREVPAYQGIDTSFLVATLTAAIQEMKEIIDTQASTITQLQADVAALKGA